MLVPFRVDFQDCDEYFYTFLLHLLYLRLLGDTGGKGTISLRYCSDASIVLNAYAPTNELASKKGKLGQRARAHFCSYDSLSMGFIPVKASLTNVCLDTDITIQVDEPSKKVIITLSSFPLKSFKVCISKRVLFVS